MRKSRLLRELGQLLEQLSGQDFSAIPEDSSFLELGFDSLLLTQVALEGSKVFGTKLKLRDFLEEHPTLGAMVAHLDAVLPPDPVAPGAAAPSAAVAESLASPPPSSGAAGGQHTPALTGAVMPSAAALGSGSGPLVDLVRQQIAILATQLELLAAAAGASEGRAPAPVPPASAGLPAGAAPASAPPVQAAASSDAAAVAPPRQGPQLVIDRSRRTEDLLPSQEKLLAALQERYCAKTAKSKAFAQRNRRLVADPRVPAGFKARLKELVYPIVVERSEGCRLWDLDGNEYIDLLNGYGSNFFGFGAPFVKAAIAEQMDRGMEIGPQTPLVEEVTELFLKLVPAERVAYCNTGSEAVLATLRMARTATGRDRVVMFSGGYHGIFDEVIVRGTPRHTSLPAAPGIPRSAVENITVLDWGTEASLAWVREHAATLAAVLVEPVQSRAPDVQPRQFLHELRALTSAAGTALIFDEVVTGFRVGPGGAQAHFGIQADLASYGKVVGGGVSIGIVAGRREYMDCLDGGDWRFGDDSIPEVGVTYFAGTFVRHPLAMAAARAVLKHLVEQGPGLQERVNKLTDTLASRLNTLFKGAGVPLELRHFSSVMKVAATEPVPLAELLHVLLRERGLHIWEGRPSFLTAVHTEREVDAIVAAFASAVRELQDARFYPTPIRAFAASQPPVPGARLGRDRDGRPAWFVQDPANPTQYLKLEGGG